MVVNERYNSKHEKNIEECIEYIRNKKYGETIPYSDLSKILNFNLDDELQKKKFKNVMNKVKNLLINHGYVLRSVNGIGYYILKPNQIPSFTFRNYIVKPLKTYEKGIRILNHTDKFNLNSDEKAVHDDISILANRVKKETENTIYNSRYYENNKKEFVDNGSRKSYKKW